MITRKYIGFASENKTTYMTPAISVKIPRLEFYTPFNKNYTGVV